jgi:hypothetical protein
MEGAKKKFNIRGSYTVLVLSIHAKKGTHKSRGTLPVNRNTLLTVHYGDIWQGTVVLFLSP